MSNENIEKVILNSLDLIDTSRRCNVLSINHVKNCVFNEYATGKYSALSVYSVVGEYEDNGELVLLTAGDDGEGNLLGFETEKEWEDYTGENFGSVVRCELA